MRRSKSTPWILHLALSGSWGPSLLVTAYFASAVVFLSWQEGWSHLDSFYFSVQVLTTIGYGDLAPATRSGKFATCIFALSGVALVVRSVEQLLSGVASNSFFTVAKRRLFRLASAGDLLDTNKLQAKRRTHLSMCRRTCVGMLLIGCVVGHFIVGIEDWFDCLYYSVITVTTVGLGDITPTTPFSRLCTALLSLLIVPLFADMLSSYIDLQGAASGMRGQELVRIRGGLSTDGLATLTHFDVQMHPTEPPTTFVTREDFLAFVLVQNSIMSKEEVRMVWDDFARLDHDGNGKITVNDLGRRISQRQLAGVSAA